MKFVEMVCAAVDDWRANDTGLTRAAVDAISDAGKVQRAFERGDEDALFFWMNDDSRAVIRDAAEAALRELRQSAKA